MWCCAAVSVCFANMPHPLLQHQFLNVIDSHRPLLALYREVRAEVTETMEPLLEDRTDKDETASSVSHSGWL